jgi:5-methylcytosine-specific restriction enzyme subunit McrC
MIPMEKLFEEFIAQMLVHNPAILPLEYRQNIQIQKNIGYLAFDGNRELFQMKADVFLDGPRRIILDTKYKMLDPDDSKNKISQPDLYQMYAYCKESGSNSAILLYPRGINTEIPERMLKLGLEQSITLFVKTIPLHFDFSKDEEVQKFIFALSHVFDFLRMGPENIIMGNSVEETVA